MSIIINDENLTGYIIIDGNGCLFGTVKGNEKTVLHSNVIIKLETISQNICSDYLGH